MHGPEHEGHVHLQEALQFRHVQGFVMTVQAYYTVTAEPAGSIYWDEISSRHVCTRCVTASTRWPENKGIVIVFPPGAPIYGAVELVHHERGDSLGVFTPVGMDSVTLADLKVNHGKLRFWKATERFYAGDDRWEGKADGQAP